MRIFLPALALLIATPAVAQLAPAERRMAAYIAADAPRGEALLECLVRQNSGTLNLEGVRIVGEMMRAELEPLGFTVEWVDMAETGRAGHLIATHRGNGRGKRILLIGHLDTVFETNSPFQGFRRDGNRAIGPGVGDDKGGLVVIVGAMRAMHAAGTLRGADIRIVLTGDEERIGDPVATARRDLVAAGRWADVALEYEGLMREADTDYGTIARRGSANWLLRTTGRTGHSSTIFSDGSGYGASYELIRILDSFRRELIEPNLTFNIGVMAGGTPASLDATEEVATATGKTNIIASDAIARGDLRALTVAQQDSAIARMRTIVDASLTGTDAELTVDIGYPPMAPTEGNRALLARLNDVNRDAALPVMVELEPSRRGAADSGFVAADVDTLGGLGAAGGRAHAEGEWLDLASISLQATRSAILISRLARQRR